MRVSFILLPVYVIHLKFKCSGIDWIVDFQTHFTRGTHVTSFLLCWSTVIEEKGRAPCGSLCGQLEWHRSSSGDCHEERKHFSDITAKARIWSLDLARWEMYQSRLWEPHQKPHCVGHHSKFRLQWVWPAAQSWGVGLELAHFLLPEGERGSI